DVRRRPGGLQRPGLGRGLHAPDGELAGTAGPARAVLPRLLAGEPARRPGLPVVVRARWLLAVGVRRDGPVAAADGRREPAREADRARADEARPDRLPGRAARPRGSAALRGLLRAPAPRGGREDRPPAARPRRRVGPGLAACPHDDRAHLGSRRDGPVPRRAEAEDVQRLRGVAARALRGVEPGAVSRAALERRARVAGRRGADDARPGRGGAAAGALPRARPRPAAARRAGVGARRRALHLRRPPGRHGVPGRAGAAEPDPLHPRPAMEVRGLSRSARPRRSRVRAVRPGGGPVRGAQPGGQAHGARADRRGALAASAAAPAARAGMRRDRHAGARAAEPQRRRGLVPERTTASNRHLRGRIVRTPELPVDMRRKSLDLADLAARQHGVVAYWQLIALGLSPEAIQRRVSAGLLHRLHRGVYAVGHRRLSRHGWIMAAVLAHGPEAVASHRTAAWLWGLLPQRGSAVWVTVPSTGRAKRKGIVLHQVRELHEKDRATRDGIPVTALGRTLIDVFSSETEERTERALEQAERLGLFDSRTIDEACERTPTRKCVRQIRTRLREHRAPAITRSAFERNFLIFCRKHNLPAPEMNAWVHGYELDAVWRDQKRAVELDDYYTHGSRRTFESDRSRDSKLNSVKWRVVRVTPARLKA